MKSLSRVRLLGIPWTAAYQAPPSMGFSRQEYWSGCHSYVYGVHICNINESIRQCSNNVWDTPCCCCWVTSVVSNSMWPHRQLPTRLPRPWDSPGKNTRVGCHFPLQCTKVKSESEAAQSCPTLSGPMDCSLPGSSVHGIFQARVLEWGETHHSKLD